MKKNFSIALMIMLVLAAGQAFAIQTSTTMNVSATVINACTITASSLAFPSYSNNGPQVDGTTTLSVTCDTGVPYSIDAEGGANFLNPDRQMFDGTSGYLKYQLFTDAGHSTPWGTIVSGGAMINGTGTATANNISIYGSIWSTQAVPAGSYTDTVNVIVNW